MHHFLTAFLIVGCNTWNNLFSLLFFSGLFLDLLFQHSALKSEISELATANLKQVFETQRCANWTQQLILTAVTLDTTYLLPSEALRAQKWVRTLLYPQLQQRGTNRWASTKQIIGTPSLTVVYTKSLQIRSAF